MSFCDLLDEAGRAGIAGGAGGLQVPRVADIPRAVIPSLELPFELTPPPEHSPSRMDFLLAEMQRRFGGHTVKYSREEFLREEEDRKERSQELENGWGLESNPAWEKFGFRGAVAKLLYERGAELVERGQQREGRSLMRKAVRFANCARLARSGTCARYPLEHKFFIPQGCEVIFCRECAHRARQALFVAYFQVIRNAVLEFAGEWEAYDALHRVLADTRTELRFRAEAENSLRELWARVGGQLRKQGWVLARINFTIWSDGSEITPERVKKMNGAVRSTMQTSIGKARGYGMLFMDEVGFETRGHIRERKAGGLNLHAHGLYFGPYLDWERTRDLWMRETEKRFPQVSRGFWVQAVRGLKSDPEGAIRHALNHMLKYVSKPPAVTAARLTSLIAAFNTAKRVHSLGLFYGKKPKREKRDCPCPKCRSIGIASTISFQGDVLPNGGCIPRLASIEELRAQGYQPLYGDGRTSNFGDVVREYTDGDSP